MTTSHPDRLLPADPRTRAIARELYGAVAEAPIISPHGHIDPALFVRDAPFTDVTQLFVAGDHYIQRLLHADGVALGDLRVGDAVDDSRRVWRILCERWFLFAGTAPGYWLEDQIHRVLDIPLPLDGEHADEVFDAVAERLAREEFRPRTLLDRFRIEVLATTDDPLDDLAPHAVLQAAGLRTRVIPTFRPDRYLDPDAPDFAANVSRLLAATGQSTTFAGYVRALEQRREHFRLHGAVSTDHGVLTPATLDLGPDESERLFAAVAGRRGGAAERADFRARMLFEMARMSVEDGLVMTVHPGIRRNHSTATFRDFGPDAGSDIPVPISFTEGMRPLLERFGLEQRLHLVLFAADESVYSRELAPLAAFYPSVYIGAPWWFLDAPDAIARFRSATVETAGFFRSSGFIDDTRAFLSIPARHDMARRSEAAFLARYVVEQRITERIAHQVIDAFVDAQPRRVFKL